MTATRKPECGVVAQWAEQHPDHEADIEVEECREQGRQMPCLEKVLAGHGIPPRSAFAALHNERCCPRVPSCFSAKLTFSSAYYYPTSASHRLV